MEGYDQLTQSELRALTEQIETLLTQVGRLATRVEEYIRINESQRRALSQRIAALEQQQDTEWTDGSD